MKTPTRANQADSDPTRVVPRSPLAVRRTISFCAWALIAGSAALAAPAHARGPATLKDLQRIAAGRPLAVVVIKGYWCPACTDELQALSKRMKQVRAVGGAVVGLSTDDAGTNAAFKKRLGLDFPLLGDPSGRLMERWGMWMPSMGHPLPGLVFLPPCGDKVVRIPGRRPGLLQTGAVIEMLRTLGKDTDCDFHSM